MSYHPRSRSRALRAYAVAESGLEPAFDRLAHLAVMATRAPICLVLFGDEALIKGYSGPADAELESVTAPRDFYEVLLGENAPLADVRGEVAGAAVRDPGGMRIGCVVARTPTPRIWTPESLGALRDIAHLVGVELAVRGERRPDERTARTLEAISDACIFLDRSFRCIYANKKAAEIFRREPADLIGKNVWTEFPAIVGHPFYRASYQALEEQTFVALEEYFLPLNRWYEARIYPSREGLVVFFQDVTERRQGNLERARLATIIESSADLVLLSSAEGKVLYLNRTGRKLLAISSDGDLPTLHIVALHSPAFRDRVCDAISEVVKDGPWRGEAALVDTNGHTIPAMETLIWHETQAPEAGYFSLTARDLTERKRAEEHRERSEAFKAQAERMAHFGYWVWKVASNRVTRSPELERIYGLDSSSFDPSFEGYLDRLHPEDRPRIRETIEHALRDRIAFSFEERIVRPSGEIRHLRSWGGVNVNDVGQVTEMFGTSLDMTDLVVATEGLRRTQEWLSTALTNTGVAVWEWNVHTNDVRFSEGAAAALGLRPENITSTFDAYLQWVHPNDLASVMEALRTSVERGKDIDCEHRIQLPEGGEKWIVARACPHRDENGRVDRLVGTFVDVTDRHRAEEEHRQLLEKLAQAQKLEAIGRLSAGVAHDFNNHLTIMINAVEHLLRSSSLDSSVRESVQNIREAVSACTGLTSQFLAFGREQKRTLKLAPMDLNLVVRDACKLLRRLLPDNVTLEFSPAPALAPVQADREQIDRVLLNLVVNARDAMPGGGRLSLRTLGENDWATLEIQDTGVGMTPEVQARIFEPFFTTKSHKQGIGLGLATVYGIVTQTGGTIDVRSEPGIGTTFVLRLRFAEKPPKPDAQPASPSSTE